MSGRRRNDEPERTDIGIFGDLSENESDILGGLLDLPDGSECRLFINSCGGSVYVALGVIALLRTKRLRPIAIALGECMSAAGLIFAACQQRRANAHTVFLFHPMRWQTREDALLSEAASWAIEFKRLEEESDTLMARFLGISQEEVREWNQSHRYLTGRELAERGLCELYDFDSCPGPRIHRRRRR